ncbi:DUF4062 domain-containing protein [Cryobacterium frigoriphilum]|nr:DUF4062 domain-containing protein [Cryobacterium frigoriphilum]
MERRYQVFISSTFEDLIDERKAIMEGLLKIDCLPAGMELFPAADDDQWTLIKSVIEQCDYYLIVSARRYGSTDEAGVSYTEKEYDYAVSQGIPIIGFLPKNPGSIPGDKIETGDGVLDKLELFQRKIRTRMVTFFESPSELQANVIVGVTRLQKSKPRPGWVRGDNALTEEKRVEIAELRARIAELEAGEAKAAVAKATGIAERINETYAHGSEKTSIVFVFRGFGTGERVAQYHSYEWSWEEIMFIIGPTLIEEAADEDLIGLINDQLHVEVRKDQGIPTMTNLTTELEGGTWSNIIVQLRALKAIKAGTKRRVASDHRKYWQLTPAGDEWVTELRATKHEEPTGDIG